MSNGIHPICPAIPCDWFESSGLSCGPGDGSCNTSRLLESGLHDHQLKKATREINTILEKISEDSNGRKLSFLHTRLGILLGWVNHGGEIPPGAVTADDDDETIKTALQLKL